MMILKTHWRVDEVVKKVVLSKRVSGLNIQIRSFNLKISTVGPFTRFLKRISIITRLVYFHFTL